jgi:hypothetical protein
MKPLTGCLRKADWEVRDVDIGTARNLVEKFHYAAGASNTAVYLHGLFRKGAFFLGECQGVAWWIPPTRTAAEATWPDNWQGVLSLSRLVIAPDVPANACTFLMARSMKMIDRSVWPCFVTYADEWRGHTGAIYRASNWAYAGKTNPERVYVANGRMTARKRGGRTLTHAEMLLHGAKCLGSFSKHKFVNASAS